MEENMKITKTQNGNHLCFALEGRLDTNTAPELETAMKGAIWKTSTLLPGRQGRQQRYPQYPAQHPLPPSLSAAHGPADEVLGWIPTQRRNWKRP